MLIAARLEVMLHRHYCSPLEESYLNAPEIVWGPCDDDKKRCAEPYRETLEAYRQKAHCTVTTLRGPVFISPKNKG